MRFTLSHTHSLVVPGATTMKDAGNFPSSSRSEMFFSNIPIKIPIKKQPKTLVINVANGK
jgi:hypothetical protein